MRRAQSTPPPPSPPSPAREPGIKVTWQTERKSRRDPHSTLASSFPSPVLPPNFLIGSHSLSSQAVQNDIGGGEGTGSAGPDTQDAKGGG